MSCRDIIGIDTQAVQKMTGELPTGRFPGMERCPVTGACSKPALQTLDDPHVLGQKLAHAFNGQCSSFRGITFVRRPGQPHPRFQAVWPIWKNRQAETVAGAESKGQRRIDTDQVKLICLFFRQIEFRLQSVRQRCAVALDMMVEARPALTQFSRRRRRRCL